jgi:ABC-type phosphate transport system substrate-binding protein
MSDPNNLISEYEAERGNQGETSDVINEAFEHTTSDDGAAGLLDGSYDVAGMQRNLTEQEAGQGLLNEVIGFRTHVLFVSSEAPASSFSTSELADTPVTPLVEPLCWQTEGMSQV